MKIVVDGEIFTSDRVIKNGKKITTNKPSVTTEIYIEHDGVYFPRYKWTDLSEGLLSMWTYNLLKYANTINISFPLYFMDGPYRLDIFKNDNMCLDVKCVRDSANGESVELAFNCDYFEFLQTLYEATKSLNYLLYKNGLNKGKFEATFRQIAILTKELKAATAKTSEL